MLLIYVWDSMQWLYVRTYSFPPLSWIMLAIHKINLYKWFVSDKHVVFSRKFANISNRSNIHSCHIVETSNIMQNEIHFFVFTPVKDNIKKCLKHVDQYLISFCYSCEYWRFSCHLSIKLKLFNFSLRVVKWSKHFQICFYYIPVLEFVWYFMWYFIFIMTGYGNKKMIVDAKKLSFSLMTRQLPLEKQDVNLRRDKIRNRIIQTGNFLTLITWTWNLSISMMFDSWDKSILKHGCIYMEVCQTSSIYNLHHSTQILKGTIMDGWYWQRGSTVADILNII